MMSRIKEGEASELPVVVKSDVHGSIDAIVNSFEKLGTDEVKLRVLLSGVGGINESDVTLANATGAITISFNVLVNPQALQLVLRHGLDLRYDPIIYNVARGAQRASPACSAPM